MDRRRNSARRGRPGLAAALIAPAATRWLIWPVVAGLLAEIPAWILILVGAIVLVPALILFFQRGSAPSSTARRPAMSRAPISSGCSTGCCTRSAGWRPSPFRALRRRT